MCVYHALLPLAFTFALTIFCFACKFFNTFCSSPTSSSSPRPTATQSLKPTADPTPRSSTHIRTSTPSSTPRTFNPTAIPTPLPNTQQPGLTPTLMATTEWPTYTPSNEPTEYPTQMPTTGSPSKKPNTKHVTARPTKTPSLKPTANPTPQPTTQYPALSPSSTPITHEPSMSQSYVEFNYDSSSNTSSSPSKKPAPAVESQDDVKKVADSNAQGGGEDEELVENYLDADSSEGSSNVMALWASAGIFLAILIIFVGVALKIKKREKAGDVEPDGSFPEPPVISIEIDNSGDSGGDGGDNNGDLTGGRGRLTGSWVEGQGTGIIHSPSYFTLETFPVDNRGSRVSIDD